MLVVLAPMRCAQIVGRQGQDGESELQGSVGRCPLLAILLKNPSGRVRFIHANHSQHQRLPFHHLACRSRTAACPCVFRGNGEAKISIGNDKQAPQLETIHGLTKREARQAWEIVAEHQIILLNAWRKIHGNLDD